MKRVLKGNEIWQINKVVDLYNYISLKYLTPIGGEDLDKIKGDIYLNFAEGCYSYGYYYDFTTYDLRKDYAIRCDGGSGLSFGERYTYGGNENFAEAFWSWPISGGGEDIEARKVLYDISQDITTIKVSAGADPDAIAAAVWDEETAGHTTEGTFGYHVQNLSVSASSDPAAIADAVWDEVFADHVTEGSFGKLSQDTYTYSEGVCALVYDLFVDGAFTPAAPPATTYLLNWILDVAQKTLAVSREVSGAVWDEPFANHTLAGSFGLLVQDIKTYVLGVSADVLDVGYDVDRNYTAILGVSADVQDITISGGSNPYVIADAVWDESYADHITDGTFGKLVQDIDTHVLGVSADIQNISVSASGISQETITQIADAVWSANISAYTNPSPLGPFGEILAEIWQDVKSVSGGVDRNYTTILGVSADVLDAITYIDKNYTAILGVSADIQNLDIPSASEIADAVWDEETVTHITDGTFGKLIQDIDTHVLGVSADVQNISVSVSGISVSATCEVDEAAIATAVWNEDIYGEQARDIINRIDTTVLSTSANVIENQNILKRIIGLVHENIFIDNPVYDGDGNLTGARIRIYDSPGNVGTANGVIGTYQITAPGDGPGKFTSWKQVRSS